MGKLQVYDPLRESWNLGDELGRLFWGLGRHLPQTEEGTTVSFVPAIDVLEDEQQMMIRAELPGLKREDIKIRMREGVLTLSGEKKFEHETKENNYYRIERSYGSFARSFTLPNTVDHGKIQATMKDGVLELRIPKKPEAQEQEVKIEVH